MKYEIGTKIRYFRERKGLNQKQLANQIGVSNSRVSNWEQGINRPDADTLASLCVALDVSADELLDINIADMQLTFEERMLITNYRNKPELQRAVKLLLGLEDNQPEMVPFYAVARGGQAFQGTVDAATAEEHKKIAEEALANPKYPEL